MQAKQYLCRGCYPPENLGSDRNTPKLLKALERSFSGPPKAVMDPLVIAVAKNENKMCFGTVEYLRTLYEYQEREKLAKAGKLTPELEAEPVSWFWEQATTAIRQRGYSHLDLMAVF